MRIECTTTFLDGRERFEKGDIFTIDDATAARFIDNGWVKKVGDETPAALPAADPADLAIHNVLQTQEVKYHG